MPKISLEALISELGGVPSGDGYKCFCPAHDDRSQSLYVSRGEKGGVVFFCHAKCSYESVMSALKSRNLMPERTLADVSSEILAVYSYRDADGRELFQKVRKAPKNFFLRKRNDAGRWTYRGVVTGMRNVPLYRLPELVAAKHGDTVFICEGEKDADTLVSLGLIATCNFDGAGKWRESYCSYFSGANLNIVIVEDNDAPGRAHGELVARALLSSAGAFASVKTVRFPELPAKGDVTDWLQHGHSRDDLLDRVEATPLFTPDPELVLEESVTHKRAEAGESTEPEARQTAKVPKALYSDYVELFRGILGTPRRDHFSHRLMHVDQASGLWVPSIDASNLLQSHAACAEERGEHRYARSLIDPHLAQFEASLVPELLFDVPPWDGRDRIAEMSDALIISDSMGFTSAWVCELIKEWLALAWKRIFDPEVQNRILILKGAQGIGKDTWINSLTAGAQQFAFHLHISAGDKDTFLQLSRGMFAKISEFDKTARVEVSLLKDLITREDTDLRASFARESRKRYSRCSFVSSCNVDDILRDYTGARRFLILEVDRIAFGYPRKGDHGAQILAQARDLAVSGFEPSADARTALRVYLCERTPEDPAVETAEVFLHLVTKHLWNLDLSLRADVERRGWISVRDCHEVLEQVGRIVGLKRRQVQVHLKGQGLSVRVGKDRERGYRIAGIEEGNPAASDANTASDVPF